MKKIVNIKRTPVIIDTDTMEIEALPEKTRSIDSIYIIPEDAKMHWESTIGNLDPVDTDVKEGDILITFYSSDLGKDFAIVKSDDWKNMLIHADEEIQKRKESWAKEKRFGKDECVGDCAPGI